MNIVLSFTEIKDLIANKYLSKKNFYVKKTVKTGTNIKLRKGLDMISNIGENKFIIFSSQVEEITVVSKKEKTILETHFDVPIGFLKLKEEQSLFSATSNEYEIDKQFLLLRNGLISSFLDIYENYFDKLENWFVFIQNLSNVDIFYQIVSSIATKNTLPQVQISAKFAKATKEELEFIWFGQSLASVYFNDNQNKLDENHKNWLHTINPTKNFTIKDIPERFLSDKEFIISYLIYMKLKSRKEFFTVNDIIDNISRIISFNDISNDNVFYWILLFDGLTKNYNSYFATSFSADLLLGFESTAYDYLKNTNIQKQTFSLNKLSNYKKLDKKIITSCFKAFAECNIENTDLLRNITSYEKDLIPQNNNALNELQKINIAQKTGLILISDFTTDIEIQVQILYFLRKVKKVLIVFKQKHKKDMEDSISTEIGKNKFIKSLVNKFPKVEFKIILKNITDKDDREIKNNIKAFVNQFHNYSELLFLSDTIVENQIKRENNWLINAITNIPLYNDSENYLFSYKLKI